MWMRPIQLFRQAVVNDSGRDDRVVCLEHATPCEQVAHVRERHELLHGVSAMPVTDPVVRARDVVEIHRCPQPRSVLCPAGRGEQPKRMNHHA